MKQTLPIILGLLLSVSAVAQNLQFHYDFAKSNGIKHDGFLTTFELFKPDSLGSTFLFVDLRMPRQGLQVNAAYFEIARNFKLAANMPLELQVGYNGGNTINQGFGNFTGPVWLAGISCPFQLGSFRCSANLLYRQTIGSAHPQEAMFTGVWGGNLLSGKLTCSGFLDIWTHDLSSGGTTGLIILTQPQLWYNIIPNWAVGTELALSATTGPGSKVSFYPTLAAKHTF